MNVYLGLSDLYIIHAEKELNKGFADLLMEPFIARYEGMKYSYLLEIKYLKRADDSKQITKNSNQKMTEKRFEQDIKKMAKEAEDQLQRYCRDEKLKNILEQTKLIKLSLIFFGHELLCINELDF